MATLLLGVRRHPGLTHGFYYRAMHYSAKRGIAITSSVCL